jgi:hypothetical protein
MNGQDASRLTDGRFAPHRLFATAVLAATLGVVACAGEDEGRSFDKLVREGPVFLDPDTRRPYSGVAFATFDEQPLVLPRRSSLREGTYDGPFEGYFHSRQLSARETYVDGVRHGPYQWFFKDGELFEEGTYIRGQLNGPFRAYWDTGDLYEEGTYLNGEFDGPRRWYLEGRLIELVTYRHGVIEGPYERYDETGRLDLRGMLVAGEPCGLWQESRSTVSYLPCGDVTAD